MKPTLSATTLRGNLYRILDEVIESRTPILVKRGRHLIQLDVVKDDELSKTRKKLKWKRRKVLSEGVEFESIVHMEWPLNLRLTR